ncbi:hypothetical protein HPB52_009521 [Rhipicephalus sanguineus]|uniref:Tick transposon n=1 Tax=Rhipicephalus sanguineus TaxID=34632 RepID=A0A9D4SYP9_RHISA|nr:hypothetical protein HPB52_009521 [Rhipicephalus sanguineus]
MNPAFHEGRRKARAEALQAKYTGRQDVLYTDAAEYENKAAHTAVAVRDNGALMACCTVSYDYKIYLVLNARPHHPIEILWAEGEPPCYRRLSQE